MQTSKELREQVASTVQKARDVINAAEKENRQLTDEDRAQITKIHADAKSLMEQADALEKQEKFETAASQFGATDSQATPLEEGEEGGSETETPESLNEQRMLAFSGWALRQAELHDSVTKDHVKAMARFGVNGQNVLNAALPSFMLMPDGAIGMGRIDSIMNAMSVGSDTGGGFTVPRGFVKALEIALLQYSAMRQVATILRTSTGEALPHPTCNDTSNEGELIEENTAVDTTGTDVAFGSRVFNAYTYSSKLVRVSNQLVRDSAFDIPALLGRLLGERLGRIQNRDCTTGNGAAKPKGIVEDATLGVTTASATALAADEILELIHSIDPAYRADPSVAFMMHDSVFLQVSLLKDGNGNYLLQPGLQNASPFRLRGYNVTANQHMASSLAASAKTMLFGAFGKYLIREVGRMRLERLRERFAEYNQLAFLGLMSFDGGLLDAGTHPVKYIQQKA